MTSNQCSPQSEELSFVRTFGQRVRLLRQYCGLSPVELAQRLRLIHKQSIYDIEIGNVAVIKFHRLETLTKMGMEAKMQADQNELAYKALMDFFA